MAKTGPRCPVGSQARHAKNQATGIFNLLQQNICGISNKKWRYPCYYSTGKKTEEIYESTKLSVLQDANTMTTLIHRAHLTLSRMDLTLI
ncbi:hypothetical protein RRG08_000342 [Elysia crispata]|uniref:Uncharacterized protein n=1 Tax=Elysia crispata TaxID=231223 RepID=A0AAE1DK65_9GAST|nr:hypothetical protein RRG08_000342 [Elysia crispata]